jgi:hypothetical protein
VRQEEYKDPFPTTQWQGRPRTCRAPGGVRGGSERGSERGSESGSESGGESGGESGSERRIEAGGAGAQDHSRPLTPHSGKVIHVLVGHLS